MKKHPPGKIKLRAKGAIDFSILGLRGDAVVINLMRGWARLRRIFPKVRIAYGLGERVSAALRYLGGDGQPDKPTRDRIVAVLDQYGVSLAPGGCELVEKGEKK